MFDEEYEKECDEWLVEQIKTLTDSKTIIQVSEWAETKRYMPATVTPKPGYFSFDVTPYLKEIADHLSVNDPMSEIAIMKGVQLGFSQGLIENSIGYEMEHVAKNPCMFVTADAGLAETILETRIQAMLRHSDLERLIVPADEKNKRKTGSTKSRLEWKGGGYLIPFGAQNAGKLRSFSIARLYLDELDGFPLRLKGEGDPVDIVVKRTAAYEDVRKIIYISTPLVKQTSKILKKYEAGDQRKYFVPCPSCGKHQVLKFEGTTDDGKFYGLSYDLDKDGNLDYESIKYICQYCSEPIYEHQKHWLLNNGEWRPTAKAKKPNYCSYHISTLYSPDGFQSWGECIEDYLKAWDIENNKIRDLEAYRTFYNLVLGEPFQEYGDQLILEQVVMHRRLDYNSGTIPNHLAVTETGSKILVLTCAVDVHKDRLDVQVIGWCKQRRFYSIQWLKIHGDCKILYGSDGEPSPWDQLRELIEQKFYIDADGRQYRIGITLIDAGYSPEPDLVYKFCSEYSSGVYPIMGRDAPVKNANFKEFSTYRSQTGVDGFNITTTIYKDRLARALRREWVEETQQQPMDHPNYPADYNEKFFKELTVEHKKEKINKITGQRMGFVWHRPGNADNHAWDTNIYNMCGLDILAWMICLEYLNVDIIDVNAFFDYIEENEIYFVDP